MVAALEMLMEEIPPGVTLVVENSAGAGAILRRDAGGTRRVHARDQSSAAGDLHRHGSRLGGRLRDHSVESVDRFVDELEREVALDKLEIFHFNDTQSAPGRPSRSPLPYRRRLIGFEGFRALLSHPEVVARPAILETPGEEEDDRRNLESVRMILAGAAA